jgi:hypothetical protein
LPGLLVGGAIVELSWLGLLLLDGGPRWLMQSALRRSWLVAAALYVGTSIWWAIVSIGIARLKRGEQ